MPYCYVAKSKSLQDWGHSVGISKHLYKVGVTSNDVKNTVSKMNFENFSGRNDWKIIMHVSIEEIEESNKILVKAQSRLEALEYIPSGL